MKRMVPYNIRKSVMHILPLGLLMAISCTKDPEPDPFPFPATQDVTIEWSWNPVDHMRPGFAPPKEDIAFYAENPLIRNVFIDITGTGMAHSPIFFRAARDTLQTRIDINPNKVKGTGTIFVGNDGAQITDMSHPEIYNGMWKYDSIWFTNHGWSIGRYNNKSK